MNVMTLLQDAAAWAWHTSLVVAVPGLILLALGHWRGFPARWRMAFAAALLLRLLLPAVPELSWHPTSSLQQVMSADPVPAPATDDATALAVEDVTPASRSTHREIPWLAIAAGIWGLGVITVAGWLVVSQLVIRRWVSRQATAPDVPVVRLFEWSCERMGLQKRIGLAQMPDMATAAVWGWLRPVVLVPANLRQTHSDDEIRGILLHELAHVRRCDVLWSWLGLAACALHWFNPLAWLALRRFHTDRELDCDRMALAKLTEPQRDAYAPALFKALECPMVTAPAALVPFFRHKHEIHTRILTIMKPTKSLVARLAALFVIPALSVLTLTAAGADEEKKPTAPETPTTEKPREETPVKRDGESARKGPRDGETKKEGPRDGDGERKVMRDGNEKKDGPRDGESPRKGPRDGEGMKRGSRDGEGAKDGAAVTGKAVVLRITGTGESVTINGETVPMNRLRGYLNEHLDADRATPLIVEAEETVPYKAVTDVMDAAKDNRVKNVSFRALKP